MANETCLQLKKALYDARHMLVAPSILSADFGKMAEAVANVKRWGADIVHCDVMDGVYVPNITFGMPMVRDLRKYTDLPLDVHLMITRPEKFVKRFAEAGADIVTFHPEACESKASANDALDIIHECGKLAGVVINADMPTELALPYLDRADIVLIMTVQAGFGGQSFKAECLEKAKYYDDIRRERKLNYLIEVDGGVCGGNAAQVKAAGVDIAVAGSAVFKATDPAAEVKAIGI